MEAKKGKDKPPTKCVRINYCDDNYNCRVDGNDEENYYDDDNDADHQTNWGIIRREESLSKKRRRHFGKKELDDSI